jgi:hypothetical protein
LTLPFHFRTVRSVPHRRRVDVPDELLDAHPGADWLSWPHPRRGPWLVRLQWTRVQERLECCGLEIRSFRETREAWPPELPTWDQDPEVLTASTLRKLPLGGMLQDLREDGWRRTEEFARSIESDPAASTDEREIAADFRRMGRRDRGARRRGVPPLAEVAAVYTAALKRRSNPTEAVADRWAAAHSTAAKWVMKARAGGHLPPAKRTSSASTTRARRKS